MIKNLSLFLLTFITLSNFAWSQNSNFNETKFKEFVWDEVGLKFEIPQFIKVNSQDDFMIEMESEDFLIYVELKDDFDSLDELNEYYEVKNLVKTDLNIKKPTYNGEISEGFIESIELGDESNIYNVFLNVESKLNNNERIAFDISVYEWNDKIEQYLIKILSSIQFFKIEE